MRLHDDVELDDYEIEQRRDVQRIAFFGLGESYRVLERGTVVAGAMLTYMVVTYLLR